MGAKQLIKTVNWEKITVYLTITVAFLALCNHLFQIKDDIKSIAVSVGKLETKVEHLEKK